MHNDLKQSAAWKDLKSHQEQIKRVPMSALFAQDSQRAERFSTHCEKLYFNYSRNNITDETLDKLIALANQQNLIEWREKLFSGAKINNTENRAAFHTAMRAPHSDNEDVIATHKKLRAFSETLIADKTITDIVHIGIGGSDLGPRLIYDALQTQHNVHKKIHFVSNVDPLELGVVLNLVNAESTKFIVASKTFTTLETMTNADSAKNWVQKNLGDDAVQQRFIAITGHSEKAQNFGIREDNIFHLPEWVGGRYSQWSAIGLPLCLAFGYDVFQSLLNGAYTADKHFQTAPLSENIPVLMAMISVWYRNFWDYRAQAILPYDERLQHLPVYLQQLDMESNGKSVNRNGIKTSYETSPVVFGEPGTNGQHAFYQMLHQGHDIIPCDFIVCARNTNNSRNLLPGHHQKLIANALGQAQALMLGAHNTEEPHKHFEGNRPSNSIILKDMSAETLGMLIAFYEHKVFAQGVIWNINSFDQWGVELGKTLTSNVLSALEGHKESSLDATSHAILSIIKNTAEPQ